MKTTTKTSEYRESLHPSLQRGDLADGMAAGLRVGSSLLSLSIAIRVSKTDPPILVPSSLVQLRPAGCRTQYVLLCASCFLMIALTPPLLSLWALCRMLAGSARHLRLASLHLHPSIAFLHLSPLLFRIISRLYLPSGWQFHEVVIESEPI